MSNSNNSSQPRFLSPSQVVISASKGLPPPVPSGSSYTRTRTGSHKDVQGAFVSGEDSFVNTTLERPAGGSHADEGDVPVTGFSSVTQVPAASEKSASLLYPRVPNISQDHDYIAARPYSPGGGSDSSCSESSLDRSLQVDNGLSSLPLGLQRVLKQGATFVHTVAGTSQYAIGSLSACGLASMNAVRIILTEERDGSRGCELLRIITQEGSFEQIMMIAPYWEDPEHLDVADIYRLPVFESSLELTGTAYNLPAPSEFEAFVRRLSDEAAETTNSVASIITKPPETVALFILKTGLLQMPELYVVFDSHPRHPTHSLGAAFVFLPSLQTTVAYLTHLFPVNNGFNEGDRDWQMQSLRAFDGYTFLAKDASFMDAVYQANVNLLSKDHALSQLRIENRTAKHRIRELDEGHHRALLLRDAEHATALQSHGREIEERAAIDEFAQATREMQPTTRIHALNDELRSIRSHTNGSDVENRSKQSLWPGDGFFNYIRSFFFGAGTTAHHHSHRLSSLKYEVRGHQQPELQYFKVYKAANWISDAVDMPGAYPATPPHEPLAHTPDMPLIAIDEDDTIRQDEGLTRDEYATVASHGTALIGPNLAQRLAEEDARIIRVLQERRKRESLHQDQLFAQLLVEEEEETEKFIYRDDHLLARRLEKEENDLRIERERLLLEENASHRTALEDRIFAQGVVDEDERRFSALLDSVEQDELFARWLMQLEEPTQKEEEVACCEHQKFAEDDDMTTTFDCAVCLEPHSEEDVAIVDSCQHKLCRDAMRNHILSILEESRFPIMCPVCAIGTDHAGVISTSVAEIVGIPPEKFQQWTDLELAAHRVTIECRRCKRTMQVDREEYTESTLIPCPLCAYVWCKHCGQAVVDDGEHTCDGEAEMRRAMKKHGYKECPGCHTIVEKTSGCNHITCGAAGCNMHFCYIDGQPIVRSVRRKKIQAALGVHYSRCQLFDDPDAPRIR